MSTGIVKWFNSQKGFGFIQPENGDKDVFVHINAVERAGMSTLNEGQKLAFDVVADRWTGKSKATHGRVGNPNSYSVHPSANARDICSRRHRAVASSPQVNCVTHAGR